MAAAGARADHEQQIPVKELYESLRPNEARMLHWSAAAVAVALWFAVAWQDPLVLLLVPVIAGTLAYLVRRSRRLDPPGEDDDFF
jgi:ABC-type long-subunit fatty acid transport system fused permease/ATPase subunit